MELMALQLINTRLPTLISNLVVAVIVLATIQCQNKTCTHMLEICSSTCLPASDISVKVAATNVLGQGPAKMSSAFASKS